MKPARRERGAVLILVLWFVVALSLLVLAGARSTRQATQDMAMESDRVRSQALLDGALQLVAQRLLIDRALGSEYRILRINMGAQAVDVEIVPSEGLVDVNVASDTVLRTLFERVGSLSQGEANILIDRIHDYIDPDDLPNGAGGAELPQYLAAGMHSRPRNSGLDDMSELAGVMGMTPDLYAKIAPFLGLNGQQRINAQAAPSALVDRLSGQQGLGDAVHAAPPEMRAALIQTGPVAEIFFITTPSSGGTVRLTAQMRSPDGRSWQRQNWLDLRPRPNAVTPWTTLIVGPAHRVAEPDSGARP